MPSAHTPAQLEEFGWTAVPRDFATVLKGVKPAVIIAAADIKVPTTELARKVDEYAKRELPEGTYNHSLRVYYYGRAILKQHFPEWKLTDETLYITALLHDIGCTPSNLRATLMSFEFYGGLLALDLLKSSGAPLPQAENVAETIIRHQDLGETGTVTQLCQVILLATVFDNVGLNPELITTETIQQVVQLYPRNGWTKCFADTVGEECALKPWAHTTAIDGFAEKIMGNTLMAPYDK